MFYNDLGTFGDTMANWKGGPGGAPKRNENHRIHGLYPLKHAVTARGLAALDRRSKPYRDLIERRAQFVAELGGEDAITKQQEVVVDMIARETLFLDQLDSWLLAQDAILVGRGRKKVLLPAFRERDSLVKRIYAGLQLIGLERKAKPVPTLADYVAAKDAAKAEADGNDDPIEVEAASEATP